ncbi:MAG: ATP-binding protein, partial [Actinomycetota bacterium]
MTARRPRPWRTLWGRLALGTVAGLLVAALVVGITASGLARRQGERAARDEFDRQAVELGRIVSRQAQSAADAGREVRVPNVEALVGPGTELRYDGLPLNPGSPEPLAPAPASVTSRIDAGRLDRDGLQRVDVVDTGGARTFATAVPLTIGGVLYGTIVVSRPAKEFSVTLGDVLPRIAAATGLGLIVGLVVILWATRLAMRPLRDMEEATAHVAEGNLGITLTRGGPEELDTLAAAFNEMVAQLRQRDRMARDFLMQITHDLRTPLTAIRGHAQALADGVVPGDRQARSFDVIASEAERLEGLVADLLDLARIQAHRFRLELADVDAAELVDRAVDAFAAQAEAGGVTLHGASGDLPVIVTDAARVRQIVANLIENALRWTPAGGTVRVEGGPRPGGGVAIDVSDTGPGIAPADREAVFEPFRSHETPDGLRGTGLGLAISRELARALGGDLAVSAAD